MRPGQASIAPPSVANRLFEEPYAFDFFQAVRLLQRLEPGRVPVGYGGPPSSEAVRFRVLVSLSFPASALHDLGQPDAAESPPVLIQTFFGLTGISGVLPRQYTELLLRLEKELRGPERRALRDWLDLFNHRLLALFYRAWEKYRPHLAYERGAWDRAEPDTFIQGLRSLVGLGTPALRNRLRIQGPKPVGGRGEGATLASIDDLALLYYGGLLAHRPRCALGLEALLRDYFGLNVEIIQFQGQWLRLEPSSQTQLGAKGGMKQLGINALAGDRVWDVQSKVRVRLGPLSYAKFRDFLPERTSVPGLKALFLLAHLVRLYVGPDLDFDVQLVLRAEEVPDCQLPVGEADGAALGWNTWIHSQPFASNAEDAIFVGEEVFRIDTGH